MSKKYRKIHSKFIYKIGSYLMLESWKIPSVSELQSIYIISNKNIDIVSIILYKYEIFSENFFFQKDLSNMRINFFSSIIKQFDSNPKFAKDLGRYIWSNILKEKDKSIYYKDLLKTISPILSDKYNIYLNPDSNKRRKIICINKGQELNKKKICNALQIIFKKNNYNKKDYISKEKINKYVHRNKKLKKK